MTALHLSCREGNLKIVQYLLTSQGSGNVQAMVDQAGNTALHWACHNGHLAIVQYLLESNETAAAPMPLLNAEERYNNHGQTALHMASTQRHFAVVLYLIRRYPTMND
jgi:ankyrin repeat protein